MEDIDSICLEAKHSTWLFSGKVPEPYSHWSWTKCILGWIFPGIEFLFVMQNSVLEKFN